jgi:hypothetical protein
MRVKCPSVEQVLVTTLIESGPLDTDELYEAVYPKLKRRITYEMFRDYVEELAGKGIIEKSVDGKWRIGGSGLFKMYRIVEANHLFNECQLIPTAFADVYIYADDDDARQNLGYKFSETVKEVAPRIICRFYMDAVETFLTLQHTRDRNTSYPGILDEFTRELGFAIWLGSPQKPKNLYWLAAKLCNTKAGISTLASHLSSGLREIFQGDEDVEKFLEFLADIGFFEQLIVERVINDEDRRYTRIFPTIPGPQESQNQPEYKILKDLVKWLMGLKAATLITIAW